MMLACMFVCVRECVCERVWPAYSAGTASTQASPSPRLGGLYEE